MLDDEEHNLTSNLRNLVTEKISFACRLLNTAENYTQLEGIQKLQKKIKQELNFLKKILQTGEIKKEHLQCSNLTHFSALINTLKTVIADVNSVNKPFILNDRKLFVDIVCNGGLTWMKVIARNPMSLSQISMGNAGYGVRSILDQAVEFVECANMHPCMFQIPQIIFVFANGIVNTLAVELEKLGIIVQGNRLENFDNDEKLEEIGKMDLTTKNIGTIRRVNLDVSAMLAYVSSVTNGSAGKFKFDVPVLSQQAEWEQQRPQKPIMDSFFRGKKLFCCQTAYDSFINIVNTVGGPNEQIRANEFLKRITVLSDNMTMKGDEDSLDCFTNVQFTEDKQLSIGGKIKERSLIIFRFGDRIKAVTVTANDGFVRAAKQNGINFVVFIHESRALTEQKENLKGVKSEN